MPLRAVLMNEAALLECCSKGVGSSGRLGSERLGWPADSDGRGSESESSGRRAHQPAFLHCRHRSPPRMDQRSAFAAV